MTIGCHQPYLFPYRGYFDLIAASDKFIIYDDAKYMKGKYINRNHFPELFTFSLEKHSDYAKISECYFKDIESDKKRFLRKTGLKIAEKYLRLMQQSYSVSYNIALTIQAICKDLKINTEIYLSSTIPHGKFVNGILDMVKALGGDVYINAPGGRELYNQSQFGDVELRFIDTVPSPSILCSL